MKKIALLSIDVEEWFHLDYITQRDSNVSMMDGLDCFLGIVKKHDVPATFFTLTELLRQVKEQLFLAIQSGHEIALHGTEHKRPLQMTLDEFESDCLDGVQAIQQELGIIPVGYRASCFSLDRDRLNVLKDKIGMKYDSSRINFDSHPLYGSIDMSGFDQKSDCHYIHEDFNEFEMPTVEFCGKNLPISGGGYLRILPWWFISFLTKRYLRKHDLFSIYIHPFEMSSKVPPKVPELDTKTNFRFKYNIKSVPSKMEKLIRLLKSEGYEFMTYKQAHEYFSTEWGS
jgi:peptidoglycan/xylan/chitin deacetylase (PgdA/CDA1 family)